MINYGGYAEMFTSRRTCFNKCYFWSQERGKDIVDREELSRRISPTGFFSAKEVSNINEDPQIVGGSMMFERKTVTLKTYDNISNMKRDDFVSYDGRMWVASSINKKKVRRQSQYGVNTPFIYYIELRR